MSASRYRIEERAEVMRVYEIVATSDSEAIVLIDSGTVEPIDLYDVNSVITVKKIPRQKEKNE